MGENGHYNTVSSWALYVVYRNTLDHTRTENRVRGIHARV